MLKITPSFIHLHDVIIRVFLLKTSLEHNLIETYIAGESTWSMMLIIIHSQGNFRDSIILLKNMDLNRTSDNHFAVIFKIS